MEKAMKYVAIFFLFLFIFSITFTKGNDFSQDLGRHLKLGEMIVAQKEIPKVNLFSYTHSSFPFINHHWLSEVIFYMLASSYGLSSLVILRVFLFLVTIGICVDGAFERKNHIIVLSITLLFTPLFLDRLDMRPELFGYVFFSFFLYMLFLKPRKKLITYTAPIIMLLWVNLHVSFVFGLFLLLVYYIQQVFQSKNISILPLVLSSVVLCINPNGISGALYPFTIFNNYGYSIVENQNIFFLNSMIFNPLIHYFFILTPIVLFTFIVLLINRKFIWSFILFVFFVLSFWQIRHLPFFVLVVIPTTSYAFTQTGYLVFKSLKNKKYHFTYGIYFIFFVICIFFTFFFINNRYYQIFDKQRSFGYGFIDNYKEATDFMLSSKLPPHMFNNFDIGGYLIYKLYPTYHVFVDNRPEAYPASFFQNTYIKLQQDQEVRKKVFKQNNIHTIFFAHTDMTPWGREFLSQIVQDQSWKIVFLNESIVIMTDDNQFKDIRQDKDKIMSLITHEEDYLELLHLAWIFSTLGYKDLNQQAMIKVQKINPSSCIVQRIRYDTFKDSPLFFAVDDVRKSAWWCF